jgi:hypothetical protein
MMDGMTNEVPMFKVDGAFFDFVTTKSIWGLAYPVLLPLPERACAEAPCGRLGPGHCPPPGGNLHGRPDHTCTRPRPR